MDPIYHPLGAKSSFRSTFLEKLAEVLAVVPLKAVSVLVVVTMELVPVLGVVTSSGVGISVTSSLYRLPGFLRILRAWNSSAVIRFLVSSGEVYFKG
jgi:hypothetical protein